MELPIKNINSHLTAIKRDKVSFPTKWLYENNFLKGKVLDFGCGFGKDVEFINSKNIECIAYDKFYFPDYPKEKFDTIICSYVLNVLESQEQEEVINSVKKLLSVNGVAYFVVRRDIKFEGFRTHKIHQQKTYQTQVFLPFKSVLKSKYCEIYSTENIEYNSSNENQEKTLIALLNNETDFQIALNEKWYRIPVSSAPFIFEESKNINYIAFYQKKCFQEYNDSINYYGKVKNISVVKRSILFPREKINKKSEKEYYKIEFENLQKLPHSILNIKQNYILFLFTSLEKLLKAEHIENLK